MDEFHSGLNEEFSKTESSDLLAHIKGRQLTNYHKFVIFQNILVALHSLHEQKSAHKNIKASHILINFNEELNDFGIQFINLLPQDPIMDDLADLKFRDLADLGFVIMQLFSTKAIDEEMEKDEKQVDWQYVE
jgi:serine/threonine protein kinase